MKPTIFIVDDDPAVRDALELLLQSDEWNVAVFESAIAFINSHISLTQQGCLILDVRMPGMGGLDLQKYLNQQGYSLPVIMITGHGDTHIAIQAMKSGAFDFFEKPFEGQQLLNCVREALKREQANRRTQALYQYVADRLALLSPREREVLEKVVDGHYNKVIAAELGISISTVELHRKRLMEKLCAVSVADLIRMLALYNSYPLRHLK